VDLASIVAELKRERDRLDNAIAALEGGSARRGRPPGRKPRTGASTGRRGGRRHMSAEARRRISEMMKKRWAERKRRAA
jgi:hypothetical protein